MDEPYDDVEDEPAMLYQEFLLDPSISVQELLKGEEIEVVDFARFEMGEMLERDQTMDAVETCG